MSVPLNRVVVMLLASGLSRRYGRRDKLMARLGHKPLIDHSADVIASLQVLARVAVCPPSTASATPSPWACRSRFSSSQMLSSSVWATWRSSSHG